MAKLIFSTAIVLLLSACTAPQPVIRYVPTEPVKVEVPQRPKLAIEDLADKPATEEDKKKAMAASIWQLMGYSKQLELLLAPYSKSQGE